MTLYIDTYIHIVYIFYTLYIFYIYYIYEFLIFNIYGLINEEDIYSVISYPKFMHFGRDS